MIGFWSETSANLSLKSASTSESHIANLASIGNPGSLIGKTKWEYMCDQVSLVSVCWGQSKSVYVECLCAALINSEVRSVYFKSSSLVSRKCSSLGSSGSREELYSNYDWKESSKYLSHFLSADLALYIATVSSGVVFVSLLIISFGNDLGRPRANFREDR